jgi:hypothetical protein
MLGRALLIVAGLMTLAPLAAAQRLAPPAAPPVAPAPPAPIVTLPQPPQRALEPAPILAQPAAPAAPVQVAPPAARVDLPAPDCTVVQQRCDTICVPRLQASRAAYRQCLTLACALEDRSCVEAIANRLAE